MKQRRNQQLCAVSCLVLYVCLGPRTTNDSGFWKYWISLMFMSFSLWIAWFKDFQARPEIRTILRNLGLQKYYSKCELRGELDDVQSSGSLFGFHPHGILSVGFSANGAWSKQFEDHAGNDTVFLIDKVLRSDNPYFKVLCDMHGGVETLNKDNLLGYMRSGRNISFIPGGFEDATAMEFGKHRTVIQKRTGFIKYALQHGYRVHPVWTFGEDQTFHTYTGMLKFRLWLNKFGIPAVVFRGFSFFPMLPRPQAEILTYVGKAIELPRIAEPTAEDVTKWHSVYCDALTAIFETHKLEAGLSEDAKIELW